MSSFAIKEREQQQQIKKSNWKVVVLTWLILGVVGLFYLEVSLAEVFLSLPEFVTFFAENFLPPDFSGVGSIMGDLLDTVIYAFIATIFSTFIALIMGLLMSRHTNSIKPLRIAARAVISLFRNIPIVIWGSLFVYIFGIGSMVAVIALIASSIGFLSKSYADSIDEISGQRLEALDANGASHLQKIVHGVLPQFMPSWINWTLFSFEINIRSSSILGLVGAGGIGIMIQTRISLFDYQNAFALIILVIILVLITEFATNALRRRII